MQELVLLHALEGERGKVPTMFRLREVINELPEPRSLLSVAKRAGVSYTTAHAIYSNHTTRVDLATLDALARALGCEPGELLCRVAEGRPRGKKRAGRR